LLAGQTAQHEGRSIKLVSKRRHSFNFQNMKNPKDMFYRGFNTEYKLCFITMNVTVTSFIDSGVADKNIP